MDNNSIRIIQLIGMNSYDESIRLLNIYWFCFTIVVFLPILEKVIGWEKKNKRQILPV